MAIFQCWRVERSSMELQIIFKYCISTVVRSNKPHEVCDQYQTNQYNTADLFMSFATDRRIPYWFDNQRLQSLYSTRFTFSRHLAHILLVLSLKDRFTSSKIIYQKNVDIIFWTKITNNKFCHDVLVIFGVLKSLKHNFWIALRYFLGPVSNNKNLYYFPTRGYTPMPICPPSPFYPFPRMLFRTNLYKPTHN